MNNSIEPHVGEDFDSGHNPHIIPLVPEEVENPAILDLEGPLVKWLSKHTGYSEKKHDPITISRAVKYHNYRLRTDVFSLKREFKKKLYRTQENCKRDGASLDEDCLWTYEETLLDYNYLKKEGKNRDISVEIRDTESIVSCPTCRERRVVTCPKCSGSRRVKCPKCGGDGLVDVEEEVNCPKCGGRGRTSDGKFCLSCMGSGTKTHTRQIRCGKCGGAGDITCPECNGESVVRCPSCEGVGHVRSVWVIEQEFINQYREHDYHDIGYPTLLESIPEGEERDREQVTSWKSPIGAIPVDAIQDVAGSGIEKKITEAIQVAVNEVGEDERLIAEEAVLYKACHYVMVEFEYAGQTYHEWVDYVDNGRIYEFQSDGFCAAWRRAKDNYYQKRSFIHHLVPTQVDFLQSFDVPLTEQQRKTLEQKLTPIKQPKKRSSQNKAANAVDDKGAKSRNFYIFLGLLFPGVHNFYAGYYVRGIIQLLLLMTGIGIVISWPWAFIEGLVVKNDSVGIKMRKGSFILMFLVWLIAFSAFIIIMSSISIASKDNSQKLSIPVEPPTAQPAGAGSMASESTGRAIPKLDFSSAPESGSSAIIDAPAEINHEDKTEGNDVSSVAVNSVKIDTGTMLVQQQAEDMELEEICQNLVQYINGLSPEHCLSTEIIPQKDGRPFYIGQKDGWGNVRLRAWIKLSISPSNDQCTRTFNALHQLFNELASSKQRITRTTRITEEKGAFYTTGCDPANFPSTIPFPSVTYLECDISQIRDCTTMDYILIRDVSSTDFIAYGMPKNPQNVNVSYQLLKSRLDQFGHFSVSVAMHLLDKNKQEIKSCSKELKGVRNFGQPMYGYTKTESGTGALTVDTVFFGGLPMNTGERGELIFPARVMELEGDIPADRLQDINSVTFTIEVPQFKITPSDVKPYAREILKRRRHLEQVAQEQPVNNTPNQVFTETPPKTPREAPEINTQAAQPSIPPVQPEPTGQEDLTQENPSDIHTQVPATTKQEDRSDLQPMIDRMAALRCREATSALYQKRLLTLLPLIRDGADVDITLPETKGNTALHYACGIGSLSITRWLVEHGANVNAVTNKGATPLDCVGADNAQQIRALLFSRGAVRNR